MGRIFHFLKHPSALFPFKNGYGAGGHGQIFNNNRVEKECICVLVSYGLVILILQIQVNSFKCRIS